MSPSPAPGQGRPGWQPPPHQGPTEGGAGCSTAKEKCSHSLEQTAGLRSQVSYAVPKEEAGGPGRHLDKTAVRRRYWGSVSPGSSSTAPISLNPLVRNVCEVRMKQAAWSPALVRESSREGSALRLFPPSPAALGCSPLAGSAHSQKLPVHQKNKSEIVSEGSPPKCLEVSLSR